MGSRGLRTAALVLAAIAGGGLAAGCSGEPGVRVRHAAMEGLREPPVLRSRHGVLRATLAEQPATFHISGRTVRGNGYAGRFVGPTLRVRPGDTIQLRLVNRLGQPTNLHSHGLHVSPAGLSDDVFRVMPAGSTGLVRIHIPRDVPSGTYWYHPHLHGMVERQVFSGLSGALIVDGLAGHLPRALRHVPDRLLALKDFQARHGAIVTRNIDSARPTTRTVDGMIDPRIDARPGGTQLWRLANIGADIWYRLRLPGVRFNVVAEDANPVDRVWSADTLILPPGKRYDVLVRFARRGTIPLETLAMSLGPDGDRYPRRRLATVRVAGAAQRPAPMPARLNGVPARLLPRFGDAHVDRRRVVTFSENDARARFRINGRLFDPRHVAFTAKVGDTEEWVLRNVSKEQHPFHIHTNDFQVMSVDGRPYHARSLQDTVPLPVGGRVVVRMRFATFTGRIVFHCHILNHEDHGMMAMVRVTRSGRSG